MEIRKGMWLKFKNKAAQDALLKHPHYGDDTQAREVETYERRKFIDAVGLNVFKIEEADGQGVIDISFSDEPEWWDDYKANKELYYIYWGIFSGREAKHDELGYYDVIVDAHEAIVAETEYRLDLLQMQIVEKLGELEKLKQESFRLGVYLTGLKVKHE